MAKPKNKNISLPKEFAPLVVSYIKLAGELVAEANERVKKANSVSTARKEAQIDRQALAQTAVSELISCGLMSEKVASSAVNKLVSDPDMALNTLIGVAKTLKPVSMGNGSEKRADTAKPGMKESDRVYLQSLGVPIK